MGVKDVSTWPVAEIDTSTAPATIGLLAARHDQGPEDLGYDTLFSGSDIERESQPATDRLRWPFGRMRDEHGRQSAAEMPKVASGSRHRVTYEDLASHLRFMSLLQAQSVHSASFIGIALTNWLRSAFVQEPSRPLLEIDEASELAELLGSRVTHYSGSIPVSLSPSLTAKRSPSRVGGFGRVTAGLLLWLESTDYVDEDE